MLSDVIRAAGADAVEVEKAPAAPVAVSTEERVTEEFVTEPPGRDETEKVVLKEAAPTETAPKEAVTDSSPVPLLDTPKKEEPRLEAVAAEKAATKAEQPPKGRPWLVPVVLLVVAALAFTVYSLL